MGWPVEEINVTAVATDGSAFDARSTDANGLVVLTVPSALYRLAYRDNVTPASPLRNGIVYLPALDTRIIRAVESAETANACGVGTFGVSAGVITVAGPEQQAFLEVRVNDTIAVGTPGLARVRVSPSLTIHDGQTEALGYALTDASGVARMSCVAGQPRPLNFTRDAFLASGMTATCAAGLNQAYADLWRTMAAIDIMVTAEQPADEFVVERTTIQGAPAAPAAAGASVPLAVAVPTIPEDCGTATPAACLPPGCEPTNPPSCLSEDCQLADPPSCIDSPIGDCPATPDACVPPGTLPPGCTVAAPAGCASGAPLPPGCAIATPDPCVPPGTLPPGCTIAAPAGCIPPPPSTNAALPVNTSAGAVTFWPATIRSDALLCKAGTRAVFVDEPTVQPGGMRVPRPVAEVSARTPNATADAASPYICSAQADDTGRVSLLLPWFENGLPAPFTVTVSAPGYAPLALPVTIAPADTLNANATESGAGVKRVEAFLERINVQAEGTIVDLHGRGLSGATIRFLRDGTAAATATSDAEGDFVVPAIQTGPYSIEITRSGNQTRTCSVSLGVAAEGKADYIGLSPAHCFTLLTTGTSGVIGKVLDDKTSVAIPMLRVCQGATNCNWTRDDGTYRLEVPPASALTMLSVGAGQDWINWVAPPTGNSPALGGVAEIETKSLARESFPIMIKARTLPAGETPGAPIASANVTIFRGATQVHRSPASGQPFNITDWNGNNLTTNAHTVWSKRNGTPQFDMPQFLVTVRKDFGANETNVTHYALSSRFFDIYSDEPSGTQHAETLVLDPEGGAFEVAVSATDRHTGAAIATLVHAVPQNQAIPTGGPLLSGGPRNVTMTSTSGSPGSFLLYSAHNPYRVCVNATALYQAGTAAPECVTGVIAGTTASAAVQARRTLVTAQIRARDPHTGWNISNYNVTIMNMTATPFVCNPGATPTTDCSKQTGLGAANNPDAPVAGGLTFPWADEGQLCLSGTSTAQTRVIFAGTGSANQHGESAQFQEARFCQAWAPGQTYWLNFTPYRAPSAIPVAGTVKTASGAAFANAQLSAVSESPEACSVDAPTDVAPPVDVCQGVFRCNPVAFAVNASPGTPFPDCSAGASDAAGAFSLRLPATGQNRTWAVTATSPGHYAETYTRWITAQAMAADFVLFPETFDAIVRVQDTSASGSHACGIDPDFGVSIFVDDLAAGGLTVDSTPAVRQVDGSCLAIVSIEDWQRMPQPMPAALNQPWAKRTHPFLVRAQQFGHRGANVTLLGPADADRVVNVLLLHQDPLPADTEFTIRGRVTDANGVAEVRANTGLLADVRAVPAAGNTCGSTVVGMTDAFGEYSFSLPCAGAYQITATPIAALAAHWTPVTQSATVAANVPTELDLGLDRVKANLRVDVRKAPLTAISGVFVDPEAQGHVANVPGKTAGFGGTTFTQVPWGAYMILATGGSAGTAVPQTPAFVAPGSGGTATVMVV